MGNRLVPQQGLLEGRFFSLHIPEGCVMNRLLQPDNIDYLADGRPEHRISCCLLKQEVLPGPSIPLSGETGEHHV